MLGTIHDSYLAHFFFNVEINILWRYLSLLTTEDKYATNLEDM